MEANTSFYGNSVKDNPFAETFSDPLCKLNLKETSDFVKSLPENRAILEVSTQRRRDGVNPVTQRRVLEAPSTPGRPVFSFSVGNFSRKNIPSKWDDAEKWLICSSCNDSPAHAIKLSESTKISKQCHNVKQQIDDFAEKSRVTEEKVTKAISGFGGSALSLDHHKSLRAFKKVVSVSSEVILKDKFTDDVELILPNFRYLEPSKEGFLFNNTENDNMKDAGKEVVNVNEVQHRDIATEMTPLGSLTTSRCHTPFKSTSPARHNTPANRSGPLGLGSSSKSTTDIAQLHECHLAKLQLGSQYDSVASNWSSREEEEKEISKSFRHFETGNEYRKSVSDSRAVAWEEEEKKKCCLRYQREEAKIQAWGNLQNAKAEAQSRKLEVKIRKMRSNLEEKLMKRMAIVHRKAEEWRATARRQHQSQQFLKASSGSDQSRNFIIHRRTSSSFLSSSDSSSCGCFPCNNNHS